MQSGDILMKKWCFGIGRARKTVETNNQGEAEIVRSFPRYRTIVLKVIEAEKLPNNEWKLEVEKHVSLTKKPKRATVVMSQKQHMVGGRAFSTFAQEGQKKPFYQIQNVATSEEGIPPVGSLVTLNKKHAIVTEVGHNEMTVWMNNQFHTVAVKPGAVRWHSDKIVANAMK